jgi:hypothetical protein
MPIALYLSLISKGFLMSLSRIESLSAVINQTSSLTITDLIKFSQYLTVERLSVDEAVYQYLATAKKNFFVYLSRTLNRNLSSPMKTLHKKNNIRAIIIRLLQNSFLKTDAQIRIAQALLTDFENGNKQILALLTDDETADSIITLLQEKSLLAPDRNEILPDTMATGINAPSQYNTANDLLRPFVENGNDFLIKNDLDNAIDQYLQGIHCAEEEPHKFLSFQGLLAEIYEALAAAYDSKAHICVEKHDFQNAVNLSCNAIKAIEKIPPTLYPHASIMLDYQLFYLANIYRYGLASLNTTNCESALNLSVDCLRSLTDESTNLHVEPILLIRRNIIVLILQYCAELHANTDYGNCLRMAELGIEEFNKIPNDKINLQDQEKFDFLKIMAACALYSTGLTYAKPEHLFPALECLSIAARIYYSCDIEKFSSCDHENLCAIKEEMNKMLNDHINDAFKFYSYADIKTFFRNQLEHDTHVDIKTIFLRFSCFTSLCAANEKTQMDQFDSAMDLITIAENEYNMIPNCSLTEDDQLNLNGVHRESAYVCLRFLKMIISLPNAKEKASLLSLAINHLTLIPDADKNRADLHYLEMLKKSKNDISSSLKKHMDLTINKMRVMQRHAPTLFRSHNSSLQTYSSGIIAALTKLKRDKSINQLEKTYTIIANELPFIQNEPFAKSVKLLSDDVLLLLTINGHSKVAITHTQDCSNAINRVSN